MARSRSGGNSDVLMVMILGGIVWAGSKVLAITGWIVPIAVILGVVLLMAIRADARRRARIQALRDKYPEDIVKRILAGQIWQGQTEEQLVDTLGRPIGVDRKILKTMRREVWKYKQTSAQRFGLRITVENGYVMGWDHKG